MNISLNPSYFCSLACDFCYLSKEQLRDRQTLSLDRLREMLSEVKEYHADIEIDLYGGEPALLSSEYVLSLKSLLIEFGIDKCNVISNGITLPNWFFDDFFFITISFDGAAREQHKRVYENIRVLNKRKPFSIITLATPKVIEQGVDYFIDRFNDLDNLIAWEIKPYSTNQNNQLTVSYSEYEDFVKKAISSVDYLTNEAYLKESIAGNRNAFSDDHIYITPEGNFAVLDFDLNGNEYFKIVKDMEAYFDWANQEKIRVADNEYCNSCEYFGRCLTEHYRVVDNVEHSCNGGIQLIQWYRGLSWT